MDGEPAGVDVPEGEKSGKRATRGRRIDRERERENAIGGGGERIKESSTREKEIKSLNKKQAAKETGREEVGHKAEEKRETRRDETND